jgi:hypothetical protein
MGAATVSLLIPNRKKNIKRCFLMNAKLRRIIIFFLKSFVNDSNSVPKKNEKNFCNENKSSNYFLPLRLILKKF